MFKNLYKINIVITGGSGDIALATQNNICNSELSNFFQVLAPDELVLDVTNEEKVKKFFEDVGSCILINCAGVLNSKSIKNMSLKDWQTHLDVNLTGSFLCSKYAILNGCKRIINICSTSSFKGRGKWSAYCVSKTGLLSLTESLRDEGIYAQSLCFGRTNTKLRRKLFPDEDINSIMQPKRVADIIYKTIKNDFANAEIIYFDKKNIFIGNKTKILKIYEDKKLLRAETCDE